MLCLQWNNLASKKKKSQQNAYNIATNLHKKKSKERNNKKQETQKINLKASTSRNQINKKTCKEICMWRECLLKKMCVEENACVNYWPIGNK